MIASVCLALCFFILSIPLYRRKCGQIILSIDNIFLLAFDFLFCILFPCVFFYAKNGESARDYLANYVALYTVNEMTWYYIIAFVFLLFLCIGYRKVSGTDDGFADIMPPPLKQEPQPLGTTFVLATFALLLVGIVADALYMDAYGGYVEYMKHAASIRNGTSDFDNPWSFLLPLRDCIPVSALLLFSQIDRKNAYIFLPTFLLAFAHGCMVYYSNKGRLTFILYFMIIMLFLFFRICRFTTANRRLLIGTGCIGAAFLGLIVILGEALSRNTTGSIIRILAEETAFFFANPKVLFDNVFSYRFFFDFISYPLYFLPSSIWRRWIPETASDMLTIFIDGSKKGENGVYGEAPVDMITLAYFQGNIIGIVLVALFWGALFAFLYKRLSRLQHKSSALMVCMYLLIELMLRSVLYCDSYNIVQRLLPMIGFAILYVCIGTCMKFWQKRKTPSAVPEEE